MANREAGWVSVLILSWNTRQLLHSCLSRLAETADAADLEIIVVDNASRDGSADMVESEFPWITLIRNETNQGFARAVNQAFARSTGDHVLLLNSDCEVTHDSIEHCRGHLARHPDVGAIGCGILYPDGTPQNSIFRFPSLRGVISTTLWLAQAFPNSAFLNHDRYGQALPGEPTDVDVVMGSFLMVRRSDHGPELLDDEYFMYTEEADLCRRLSERGLKVRFLPEVTVAHVRGASSRTPRARAWSDEAKKRALLRYLRKWHGIPSAYVANLAMLLGVSPRVIGWAVADLARIVRGRPPASLYKARAVPFHLTATVMPWVIGRRFEPPPDPDPVPHRPIQCS